MVDIFLDKTLSVAVDIASRNVGKNLKLLAFLGQLENALAAEVIDLERVLKRVIKVDASGAVDDDVAVLNEEVAVMI